MYKKVELKNGFVGMEKEVAEKWKAKEIIKKNFEMNKGGRYFTFYDGPPTANGKPHVGHIERISSIKKSRMGYTWITSRIRNRKEARNIRKRTNRRIWSRKIRKRV